MFAVKHKELVKRILIQYAESVDIIGDMVETAVAYDFPSRNNEYYDELQGDRYVDHEDRFYAQEFPEGLFAQYIDLRPEDLGGRRAQLRDALLEHERM